MDEYEGCLIPDVHVEICLKVLRSIRNKCLGPGYFNADGAVVLSHAHATIVKMVEQVLKIEAEEERAIKAKSESTSGIKYCRHHDLAFCSQHYGMCFSPDCELLDEPKATFCSMCSGVLANLNTEVDDVVDKSVGEHP